MTRNNDNFFIAGTDEKLDTICTIKGLTEGCRLSHVTRSQSKTRVSFRIPNWSTEQLTLIRNFNRFRISLEFLLVSTLSNHFLDSPARTIGTSLRSVPHCASPAEYIQLPSYLSTIWVPETIPTMSFSTSPLNCLELTISPHTKDK